MATEGTFNDEQLEAAIAALSDPASLRAAQDLVMRTAPRLQAVLADALEQGGWFGLGHEQAVADAVAAPEPADRLRDVRALLAEETRLGMFVGVAVGIGLAQQLKLGDGLGQGGLGEDPEHTGSPREPSDQPE